MNGVRWGATGRTLAIWATGIVAATVLVVANVTSLHAPTAAAKEQGQRAVPATLALRDTALAITKSQARFLTALQTQDSVARGTEISAAQAYGQSAITSWTTYQRYALNLPGEAALRQAYQAATDLGQKYGAQLVSISPSSPLYASTLIAQTSAAAAESAALTTLQTTMYDPLVRGGDAKITSGIARARTIVLGGFGLLGAVFTIIAFALMGGARRDQRVMSAEAVELRTGREQAEFDAALQRALEMAPTEEAAVRAVRKALTMVAADTPTEVLLADSSHAHLHQVLSTHPTADAACQVGLPSECPAASDGHTRVFDSRRLDCCRFVEGGAGGAWAVCVPLNVAGRTTGVIHAQQAISHPPCDRLPADLEVVARKMGDRLGALRVLARTEAQAQTDPLTGLPNRRTLDAQTYDLVADGIAFVVAYADLDHFKEINDTFGHDSGDRALRVFARVLRDCVRPGDLVARHGGEEFLLVLPDCSLPAARSVAERIRTELAMALAQAAVPPFTVTIGLAASEPGDAFSEVVARADATMLKGKAFGRDRVLDGADTVDGGVAPAPPCAEAETPAERYAHLGG